MEERLQQYIETWERRCYVDGIPDEAPEEIKDMVPNYKSIALAILKNDTTLKCLGLSAPVSPYYTLLKKIEIEQRVKK